MSDSIVIVRYRALAEQVETAKREIAALVASVLAAEPECGGITMLQEAGDATLFTLIETWPSQQVFLGPHMSQPHIQAFIQSAGAFLAGPPDISFWNPLERAVVAGG